MHFSTVVTVQRNQGTLETRMVLDLLGKNCVEACFERDGSTLLPQTHLDNASVFPNAWNKMRVGNALRVFSEKTLAEQFSNLGTLLGCHSELLFHGDLHEDKDISTKNRKRLSILKEAAEKQVFLPDNVRSELAGLEYSVYVSCIFNERFMNKHKNITLDNIDQIKGEMEECLEYFAKWRDASVALRKDKEHTEWAKYFVCQKTYNNL